MTISSFTGQYDFLSNFYPSPIDTFIQSIGGGDKDLVTAKTVEHAFQALKVDPRDPNAPSIQRYILNAQTPGSAKKRGRAAPLHPGWDDMRVPIMRELLHFKFADPYLRRRLLATGTEELVEGNTWGDTFWGVDSRTGEGQNHLGRQLMLTRMFYAL